MRAIPTVLVMPCTLGPAPLRTERDVVETLAGRTVTLDELYAAIEASGVHTRDEGEGPVPGHPGDRIWRRRARNALQALKATGRAERVAPSTWVIAGSRQVPTYAVLVLVPGELGPIELALSDAAQYLDRLAADGIAVDLVLTDPPYGLHRAQAPDPLRTRTERVYARDHAKVLRAGYVEVDPGAYAEFTWRWVSAAAALLGARPGGYLAVVTGPGQAARVQCAAEDAGLSFVNQVVARRQMPVFHPRPRKFSHGHYVVTICCSGPVNSSARFFHVPEDLPTAASGRPFPRTWWDNVGRSDRPGLVRYENQLPVPLVSRLVRALTAGPDSGHEPWSSTVVDPMLGGGTTAVACCENQRRCRAADLNPAALRFTLARLSAEHLAPTPAS